MSEWRKHSFSCFIHISLQKMKILLGTLGMQINPKNKAPRIRKKKLTANHQMDPAASPSLLFEGIFLSVFRRCVTQSELSSLRFLSSGDKLLPSSVSVSPSLRSFNSCRIQKYVIVLLTHSEDVHFQIVIHFV